MVLEERYYVGYHFVGEDLKLKNSAILCMLEDMASLHGTLAGEDITTSPTVWLLSAYRIEIKRRPNYGERVVLRTWSRENRNFFGCREFEIVSESGELLVCALSEWAHLNRVEGRFEKVTPELSDSYHPEPERTNFGAFRVKRSREPKDYIYESKFMVGRNWIDANRHMNNVYYLDLAEMALPEDIYAELNASSIEIFYFKEIKCGDSVCCKVSKTEGGYNVSVYSEDGETLHARIIFGEN